ncbi:MAG: restriction endonuclease subunit S [Myxococcales bacterium]|nr:restriction endonuclease subunit S [Myxococcales bacterium]
MSAIGKLPLGWQWTDFPSVATIASNLVDPSDHGSKPHIAPDHIERNTGRLLAYRTIREDKVTSPKHHFRPGQLLYSKIRPYLNKCVRITFTGLCSADIYPLDSHINPDYLLAYILSDDFVTSVVSAAGSRTVLPKVNQEQLAEVQVPVAPEREQQRIVEALDSYLSRLDSAVASLQKVQTKLKAYRASVLKAAVEGRLVPTEAEIARREGRDYEPASVLLARILKERRRRWEEAELARMKKAGKPPKDDAWKTKYQEPEAPDTSKLPLLPEGWCWASVDQLTDGGRRLAYGVLVPGEDLAGGVPFIRVGDLRDGTVDTTELKYIARSVADQFPRTYVMGGEVLISLVGTIGRTAIVPRSLAGANVARAVGMFPSTSMASERWIEIWFRSPSTRAELDGKAHEVARKTLNLEDVRIAAVAIPPRTEQERIVSEVEDLDSVALAQESSVVSNLQRLARLRQSILKWAFEGKLVDQDPNDEPAEELLARIRAERAAAPMTKTRGRKAKSS